MGGTKEGGLKAAETNRKRYGEDFYQKMGRMGGAASRNGGFAKNPELAREAGRKGGKGNKGKVRSLETRQKMSEAHKKHVTPAQQSWLDRVFRRTHE